MYVSILTSSYDFVADIEVNDGDTLIEEYIKAAMQTFMIMVGKSSKAYVTLILIV